jgi:hypothetical protein
LFGLIPSTAQVIGSVKEGKKCDGLRVCTKRHVEGILMEMGEMKARIKVQKSINIFSTINKGWRWQWKTVGG